MWHFYDLSKKNIKNATTRQEQESKRDVGLSTKENKKNGNFDK